MLIRKSIKKNSMYLVSFLLMGKNKSLKRQINTEKWTFGPFFSFNWSMTAKPHKLQNWRKKVQFVTGWDVKSCLLTKKNWPRILEKEYSWVLIKGRIGMVFTQTRGFYFGHFKGISVECFEPQRAPLGRIQFFQSCYYKAFLTFESCKSYGM